MFKLFLLLEVHVLDVICVQETWLTGDKIALQVPGFQVFKQRRQTGSRGGLAILVRKGIRVSKVTGNEYAQAVKLQLPTGEAYWVGNAYLPPSQNLARQGVEEGIVRASLLDVVMEIPHNAQLLMCGDYNARVVELAPIVGDA